MQHLLTNRRADEVYEILSRAMFCIPRPGCGGVFILARKLIVSKLTVGEDMTDPDY